MTLDKDTTNKLISLGSLGYDLDRCVNVIDPADEAAFRQAWNDPASEVRKAYQKGADRADFLIDNKLFQMAKEGDIKALEKLEERKRLRELADARKNHGRYG